MCVIDTATGREREREPERERKRERERERERERVRVSVYVPVSNATLPQLHLNTSYDANVPFCRHRGQICVWHKSAFGGRPQGGRHSEDSASCGQKAARLARGRIRAPPTLSRHTGDAELSSRRTPWNSL